MPCLDALEALSRRNITVLAGHAVRGRDVRGQATQLLLFFLFLTTGVQALLIPTLHPQYFNLAFCFCLWKVKTETISFLSSV